MGTSLTVQPFASLPSFCSDGVPRLLINLERVGGLGSRPDDFVFLGDCDVGVRELAAALGWEKDLELIWNKTEPEKDGTGEHLDSAPKSKDEKLEDDISNLTNEVDRSLKLSEGHLAWLRDHLAENMKRDLNQA